MGKMSTKGKHEKKADNFFHKRGLIVKSGDKPI